MSPLTNRQREIHALTEQGLSGKEIARRLDIAPSTVDGHKLALHRRLMTRFCYLATPYSKYHMGLHGAYELACEQRALFVRARIPCFSPIVHSHGVALYGDIDPLDHGVWLPDDAVFMRLAGALVVVKAPGWRESKGIAHEIVVFEKAGKPVYWMEPGVIPPELLEKRVA